MARPEDPARSAAARRLSLLGYVLAAALFAGVFGPLLAPPPRPRPVLEAASDRRHGLSLERRKKIFQALARGEGSRLRAGKRLFPGRPWNQFDHRAHLEQRALAGAATRFDIDLPVAHAIFQEGIKRRWPGPGGRPLEAGIVPLDPDR